MQKWCESNTVYIADPVVQKVTACVVMGDGYEYGSEVMCLNIYEFEGSRGSFKG